jgi:hypothetical protein
MDKEFWLNKWQAKEIGFHLSEYHPLLQKYFSQIFSEQSAFFFLYVEKAKICFFLRQKA